MVERMPWRITVGSGLHDGAEIERPPGALLLIGADASCDIVLADDGVAPRHLSLLTGEHAIELRTFDGAVNVTTGGGEAITLSPGLRQELHHGAKLLLAGSAVKLVLNCEAAPVETELPVPETVPAAPPRRWFRATAAAALFATIAVSAGVAAMMHGGAAPAAPSKEALVSLIAESDLQTVVRIVDEGAAPALRGIVEPAAAQALQQRLVERGWRVALRLQSPAELLAATENVFRTHGVSARLSYLGDGRIEAAQVDADEPKLLQLAETARRDVNGLAELRFAPGPRRRAPLADAGKRLTAIVSGPTPYVATADNSRYLVGAVLPDGHRVQAIDDGGVQLERDGVSTRLAFDDETQGKEKTP
jgi:type III secretion system YscD/HrpQ family protein